MAVMSAERFLVCDELFLLYEESWPMQGVSYSTGAPIAGFLEIAIKSVFCYIHP